MGRREQLIKKQESQQKIIEELKQKIFLNVKEIKDNAKAPVEYKDAVGLLDILVLETSDIEILKEYKNLTCLLNIESLAGNKDAEDQRVKELIDDLLRDKYFVKNNINVINSNGFKSEFKGFCFSGNTSIIPGGMLDIVNKNGSKEQIAEVRIISNAEKIINSYEPASFKYKEITKLIVDTLMPKAHGNIELLEKCSNFVCLLSIDYLIENRNNENQNRVKGLISDLLKDPNFIKDNIAVIDINGFKLAFKDSLGEKYEGFCLKWIGREVNGDKLALPGMLHIVAQNGSAEQIKKITSEYDCSTAINEEARSGCTPVMLAVFHSEMTKDHMEGLKVLLDVPGIYLNYVINRSWHGNNKRDVMDFAQRPEDWAQKLSSRTMLKNAGAVDNVYKVVGKFLTSDEILETPAVKAILDKQEGYRTLGELCRAGLKVNQAINKSGLTLLQLAAGVGNVDAVSMLLVQESTNVNQTDFYGRTALDYAMEGRNLDITLDLLMAGANKSQLNLSKKTIKEIKKEIIEENEEAVKEIIEKALKDSGYISSSNNSEEKFIFVEYDKSGANNANTVGNSNNSSGTDFLTKCGHIIGEEISKILVQGGQQPSGNIHVCAFNADNNETKFTTFGTSNPTATSSNNSLEAAGCSTSADGVNEVQSSEEIVNSQPSTNVSSRSSGHNQGNDGSDSNSDFVVITLNSDDIGITGGSSQTYKDYDCD